MAKISKKSVDALLPQAGDDVVVWDDRLKGFGVRVKPSGGKTYILQYRNWNGVSRRITIGRHGETTAEQARAEAAKMLATIRLGADPAQLRKERRSAKTVAELAELWLTERPSRTRSGRPKKASSWRVDAANIKHHVLPLLGHKDAVALTKPDIEKWKRDVAVGRTASARAAGGVGVAGRAFDALSSMLAWAADEKIIPFNAATGIRRYQAPKRQRFLSGEELARLGETIAAMESEGSLPPYAAAIIRLLALTGCRKGEITGLQWQFVDFDRRVLNLPDGKAGERLVPLGAAALRVLSVLPRIAPARGLPDWVFPAFRGAAGAYSLGFPVWKAVITRAGLPGFRVHDLRHSFASLAAANGTSTFILSKLLGHSTAKMAERYAHLADDPLRAAADATAKRVADAMNGDGR